MLINFFEGFDKGEIIPWLSESTTIKFVSKLRHEETQLLKLASSQSTTPGITDSQLRITLNKAAAIGELLTAIERLTK